MLVVLSNIYGRRSPRVSTGDPRDERPAMRTSPPPRQRRDAAAFPPLVVPKDAPAYARQMLLRLDRAITRQAAIEPAASRGPTEWLADEPGAEVADKTRHLPSGRSDPRLGVASRMRAHADGATAFFLFHYLRLLGEQVEARACGRALPAQIWAMPDWSPASPSPRPRVNTDRRPSRPSVGGRGNIALARAFTEHGS